MLVNNPWKFQNLITLTYLALPRMWRRNKETINNQKAKPTLNKLMMMDRSNDMLVSAQGCNATVPNLTVKLSDIWVVCFGAAWIWRFSKYSAPIMLMKNILVARDFINTQLKNDDLNHIFEKWMRNVTACRQHSYFQNWYLISTHSPAFLGMIRICSPCCNA